jgi:2-desacetyl-2-hydroxyethyl bacteriochlorophyllide A dehydrogenase
MGLSDMEKHKIRSLQIAEPGTASVIEIDCPSPGPDDVLVEIEAISTCPHWDRHIFEGRPMFAGMRLEYPYWEGQPGHEAVGRIAECGASVSPERKGERVAVWRDAGPYRRGLYATHAIVPAENTIQIPEDIAAPAIASLELAMCVQVSIDQLVEIGAIAGRRIVVSGMGPAGLIAVQLAVANGASEVWAVDPEAGRRALALDIGATHVCEPGDPAMPESRNNDDAFYAGLDMTGLPVSIEALMPRCKRALAIFGVLRDPVRFGPSQWYGGFSLIGYGEHNRGAADRALEAVVSGKLRLEPLITHHLPLSQYAEGVALLQRMEAIKVLFDPKS